MDTKTLVIGQDVCMVSGVYMHKGKVSRVMPPKTAHPVYLGTVVEVQTVDDLIHFDRYGEACDGKGTYECGPWELVDSTC